MSLRLTGKAAEGAPTLVGLPDVGLVGTIATSYIVANSDSKFVGSIDLEGAPPVVVVQDGKILDPIRLYRVEVSGRPTFSVVYSDIPVFPQLIWSTAKGIVDFAVETSSELIVSLGGVPEPNRFEIERPRVFVVSNDRQLAEDLAKKGGAEPFETGFITGHNAALIKVGTERGLKILLVLAQSHLQYPDPGASAEILTFINKVFKTTYDVQPLIEQADSIRLQLRDLMRRTAVSMSKIPKGLELEAPPGYIR
ncbi:MAG: PAC2 family protein [Thaumarchaeota archaeon]|nr:PAC2 family protein [Candidatus Calditenuaceae archaeon]MDW8041806.1 PAC2 family protein [Nitrososphaerota archaeon]